MARQRLKRYFLVRGLRVFGAPVYLHISAVVVAGILGLSAVKSPIYGIVAIVSYLSIIFVHEAGHALVAHRMGFRVLNIQVGWFHGVCEYEGAPDEWGAILVAWGGVSAQVAVAIVVLTIAALLPGDDLGYFGPVAVFLGVVNLAVAAINLAPSDGLDGGLAWRIVPYLLQNRRSRRPTRSARDKARKRWGVRD